MGYKDRANAKTMGSRLVKKLTDASAGSAAAADGDNQDAGEVTFKAGRKCKATGTAGGDASPVKGEISMTDGFRILTAPNLLCSRSFHEEVKG